MDILRLLPKDIYDAATGAALPSASNVFATIADVTAAAQNLQSVMDNGSTATGLTTAVQIDTSFEISFLADSGSTQGQIYATPAQVSLGKSNGADINAFVMTDAATTFIDDINSKGIVYGADYSAAGILDDRWIPDYGAVTSLVGAYLPLAGGTMTGSIEVPLAAFTSGAGTVSVTASALAHSDGTNSFGANSTNGILTFENGTSTWKGNLDFDTLSGSDKTWSLPNENGVIMVGPGYNALIATPTVAQDGYVVSWDNTAGKYDLVPVTGADGNGMFDASNNATAWAVTAATLGGATTLTGAANNLIFNATTGRFRVENSGFGGFVETYVNAANQGVLNISTNILGRGASGNWYMQGVNASGLLLDGSAGDGLFAHMRTTNGGTIGGNHLAAGGIYVINFSHKAPGNALNGEVRYDFRQTNGKTGNIIQIENTSGVATSAITHDGRFGIGTVSVTAGAVLETNTGDVIYKGASLATEVFFDYSTNKLGLGTTILTEDSKLIVQGKNLLNSASSIVARKSNGTRVFQTRNDGQIILGADGGTNSAWITVHAQDTTKELFSIVTPAGGVGGKYFTFESHATYKGTFTIHGGGNTTRIRMGALQNAVYPVQLQAVYDGRHSLRLLDTADAVQQSHWTEGTLKGSAQFIVGNQTTATVRVGGAFLPNGGSDAIFEVKSAADANLLRVMRTGGNVAINAASAASKLTVGGDVETTGAGEGVIVLDDTNGTRYRIYMSNGVLTTQLA